MKNLDQQFKKIQEVVLSTRLVADRVAKLEKMGFNVAEYPMGTGGILQKKRMANSEIRVQIGYGHGRWNYAMCVTL